MRLRCDRCLLFKHSLCLQADGSFDAAWEEERLPDTQEEARGNDLGEEVKSNEDD
jgi:hypothetical protein